MDKLFKLITTCLLAIISTSLNEVRAQDLRSYTNKSVLSSGKTVKIRVQEEGIYSFSYDELRNMGFSNPKNVHLRGYGGELLNEDFTESNHYIDDLTDQPVVDLGDRVAFYLRGVVKLTKANNSTTNNIGITDNYTSDYSYYFLHEENTEAKRIEFADKLTENDTKETTYTAIGYLNFTDINIGKTGRIWYGSKFSNDDSKKFTIKFNNLVNNDTAWIHSKIMSSSSKPGYFHISTNLTDITKKIDLLDKDRDKNIFGKEMIVDFSIRNQYSDNLSFTCQYNTDAITGAGYIDYIIAAAKCHLKSNVDYQMIPVSSSYIDTNITYAALNSNSSIQVWDVSEIEDVKRVPTRMNKDSLIFTIKTRPTIGRYIMVNWNAEFKRPEIVGNVDNQNLHALKDIEYVVVTNSEFINQAKEIADFHKQEDGMSVAVVTSDQVFNEFSSGTPDPTAIRAFMKMLWDRAAKSKYGLYPQYLLLIGDGTYDNRGIYKITDYNKMLTYQSVESLNESYSYSCDDYFGYLEDSTLGYNKLHMNKRMNIGVGRFPVSKTSQAENLVNKVKQYYASEPGEWKTKILALADDNEEAQSSFNYHLFLRQQEEAISTINDTESRMNISRIYWDNFTCDMSVGSRRYPDVTAGITKKFNEGALIFNYLGHGSYNAISTEHSYSISQLNNSYNKIYPVWFAGSCNVSQYDDFRNSFGEEIVLNPNGGAIASIGAVRTAYSDQNLSLDKNFLKQLFNPENEYRLGKIYRAAKTANGSDSNKMVYILLGDPGVKLKVPELNLVVDSIITLKRDGTVSKADTLKALSREKFFCHVEDETGNTLTQFNGIVNATLKDKEIKIKTKANKTLTVKETQPNGSVIEVTKQADPFTYYEHKSILYSGSTVVTDGKFEIQMIIPKDINYKVEYGRLSMYAYDENNGWDAMGSNDSFLIGGSASDVESDNIGPNISLTTNGNKYKDGYNVNPNPMIYVELSDASGINVTGSSVGHNITLIIDDDTKNVISLNSYFKYNIGSCTEGKVEYHIGKNLSEGWHTIKVKAWDLQNNSSESSIRIFVTEKLAPEIDILTVCPNPAKDNFTVFIKTNRPDEVQTIECSLMDLSGREISKKELKDKQTDGFWKIEWNLNEKGKVASGLYFLRVRIATEKSNFAEKTEKIMVIAQ